MQTLANPRSMFAAQLIGAALAVFIAPAAFWLYYTGEFWANALETVFQS